MKIQQINVTANGGSTGRIAEGIGLAAQNAGHESWIAWGRYANPSQSNLIQIGGKPDYLEHCLESRIFDNHGLASRSATKQLLRRMTEIQPDIVHLHNIHGYYLNYPLLFDYIEKANVPVVWTLHDCWPFTGHCAFCSACGCDRWKTGCHHCPQKGIYPASYLLDCSRRNYDLKKQTFSRLKNLHIVSVSHWLDDLAGQSFLQNHSHSVIHNGIDTTQFSPAEDTEKIREALGIQPDEIMLLGVAFAWSDRKGLRDFVSLSRLLSPREKIVLIGLSQKQIKQLPWNIIGIERTESVQQLAEQYSAADLFLNLTYEDNYPTTNLEAISCGTPCLTYQTGGSPESVTAETGFVVNQGDLNSVLGIARSLNTMRRNENAAVCREYALKHFRQEDRYREYVDLYEQIIKQSGRA